MASSNASPAAEHASKEYQESDSKDTIRHSLQGPLGQQFPKWGFSIVRCSYSSQPRWEQYLRSIRAHIDEQLDYKEDTFIREALEISLIEDEKLEGASWEQAREKFDSWVLSDLKISQDDFSKTWNEPENEQLMQAIRRSKRWQFFIFADQDSIDSVVDCGDSSVLQRAAGAYYFTLVATGRVLSPEKYDEDYGSDDSDEMDEEVEEEERIFEQRVLHQKFKVKEYLHLYASVLDSRWPEEYYELPGEISSVYGMA